TWIAFESLYAVTRSDDGYSGYWLILGWAGAARYSVAPARGMCLAFYFFECGPSKAARRCMF
ncbi:MAG TPA: hypothetical protein VIY86_14105, partial [Pirellulaceae bacterium]